MSTPAARIWGPPMPKISTSARCLRAVANRAAYMSPLASPAERRRGMGGIWSFLEKRSDHLIERGFAGIGGAGGAGRSACVDDWRWGSVEVLRASLSDALRMTVLDLREHSVWIFGSRIFGRTASGSL